MPHGKPGCSEDPDVKGTETVGEVIIMEDLTGVAARIPM